MGDVHLSSILLQHGLLQLTTKAGLVGHEGRVAEFVRAHMQASTAPPDAACGACQQLLAEAAGWAACAASTCSPGGQCFMASGQRRHGGAVEFPPPGEGAARPPRSPAHLPPPARCHVRRRHAPRAPQAKQKLPACSMSALRASMLRAEPWGRTGPLRSCLGVPPPAPPWGNPLRRLPAVPRCRCARGTGPPLTFPSRLCPSAPRRPRASAGCEPEGSSTAIWRLSLPPSAVCASPDAPRSPQKTRL